MFIICASLQQKAPPNLLQPIHPSLHPMKLLLPRVALPVRLLLVAAQRIEVAGQARASCGHGLDGAFPGAPVP